METLQHLADNFFIFIGFGILAGLLAKALLPGRDAGGTVATLLMGIGGTIIGSGIFALCFSGQRLSPLSPLGFVAAVLGSTVLLVFHRLLSGRFFREEGTGAAIAVVQPRQRKRMTRVLTKEQV